YAIGKRYRETPGRNITLPQERRQKRKALTSHRRMPLIGLVLEADAGLAKRRIIGWHALVGGPLLPPVVAGVDPVLRRDVVRSEPAPKLPLHNSDALRARHRREARFEQPVVLHSLPVPAPGADRDVGVAGAKVANLVAGRHPDGEVGMFHLEGAKPPGKPG